MLPNRDVKPKAIKLFTVYKNLCVSSLNQGADVKIWGKMMPVNFNI